MDGGDRPYRHNGPVEPAAATFTLRREMADDLRGDQHPVMRAEGDAVQLLETAGVDGEHAGRKPGATETPLVDNRAGSHEIPEGGAVHATRVVLADDDVLLREGLASLLERSGFAVVGQCGEGSQLLALVREHRPELVVVDIRMPPEHTTEGLDAARLIQAEFPETGILVLSAHVEVEHAMDLLAGGQRTGYLLKSRVTDVEEFIETLERIVKGASVVDPLLVRELVAARRVDDPLEVLTAREREVLGLMAEGRSNAGIARQLWVTEGTVEKHVHSILGKLRLHETDDDHRRVLAVIAFLDAR
jgi:DNA-binding NarL/FixJ family response regulator